MATVLLSACASEAAQQGPGDTITDTVAETTMVTEPPTTTTTVAPTTTAPPPVAPAPAPTDGLVPVTGRITTTDPVIFVTMDDGTDRDPAIVDYLEATSMPVSMFLNAQYLNANPAYFASITALGNVAHSHTLNHAKLPNLTAAEQRTEICGMKDLIAEKLGSVGSLMRPPYGAYNAITREQAATCGITAVVMWAGELQNGALKLQGPAMRAGDIYLMHFRPDTVANLIEIRRLADANGFRIARLESYLS